MHTKGHNTMLIIPYQELPGNYNILSTLLSTCLYYTVPRTTRELQPADGVIDLRRYYTIAMRTLER